MEQEPVVSPNPKEEQIQYFPITFACGLRQGWPLLVSRVGQIVGEINRGTFSAECVLHHQELVKDIYYLKSNSQQASEI